jgi:hypothetical protein
MEIVGRTTGWEKKRERVGGSEYLRSTLFICMKTAQ